MCLQQESTASEAATSTATHETTRLDVVSPVTVNVQSASGSHMSAASSTASRRVDTIQNSSWSASAAVGGGADIPGHGVMSPSALPLCVPDDYPVGRVQDENVVVLRTEQSGSLDALPPPDTADPSASSPYESLSQTPSESNGVGAVADHTPDHENDQNVDQVAALTAAAAHAVVRQSTAAVPHLILASTEELARVDGGGKHNSTTTL